MILPVDISDQIKRSRVKGIKCQFVKIDETWGIKAYKDEEHRDEVFDNQCRLAYYELAPPVGEKITIGDWHCYTTRVAETIYNAADANFTPEWYETENLWQKDIDKLRIQIRETCHIIWRDDHICNVGIFNFNGHDKLVCIDLGFND